MRTVLDEILTGKYSSSELHKNDCGCNKCREELHLNSETQFHYKSLLDEIADEIEEEFSFTNFSKKVIDFLKNGEEILAVHEAITTGNKNENSLSDLIFFHRHPERKGKLISKNEPKFKPLSQEWLYIRNNLIRPLLKNNKVEPSQKKTAVEHIKNSFNEISNIPWKNTNKDDVKKRLIEIVSNPDVIYQDGLNTCGPAAFLRQWANRSPIEFAQFATDLYKSGQAKIGSYNVSPITEKKHKYGNNLIDTNYALEAPKAIPAADWYIMSSLRNQENGILDFQGIEGEDVSAMTLPKDLIKWLIATNLYGKISDEVNLVFSKSYKSTANLNPEDTDIFLYINSHMLHENAGKGENQFFSLVNHIVVLDSKITLQNNYVSFKVWSWGAVYNLNLKENVFVDNYYGAVVAKLK